MVFFLFDEILVVDNYFVKVWVDCYDFEKNGEMIKGKLWDILVDFFKVIDMILLCGDYYLGEYVKFVIKVKESFCCGDFFEVVLG